MGIIGFCHALWFLIKGLAFIIKKIYNNIITKKKFQTNEILVENMVSLNQLPYQNLRNVSLKLIFWGFKILTVNLLAK